MFDLPRAGQGRPLPGKDLIEGDEPMTAPAVVVGIKETGNSRAARRLAAQEARYRDATLIAVMAYGGNPALGAPAGRPMAASVTAGDERLTAEWALGDALAGALGAQLLVLAGGGTTSVLPGTTSQYVLRKAPCPVLIVPDEETA